MPFSNNSAHKSYVDKSGKQSERWSIEIGDLSISNIQKDKVVSLKAQDLQESLNYKGFTFQLTKGRFRYLSASQNRDLIRDFTMILLIEAK